MNYLRDSSDEFSIEISLIGGETFSKIGFTGLIALGDNGGESKMGAVSGFVSSTLSMTI